MNRKRALLCVEPLEHRRLLAVDPFVQTAKLFASEGGEFDRFGFSVAGSGDMIVVGSVDDDNVGAGDLLNQGSAYVFQVEGFVANSLGDAPDANLDDGVADVDLATPGLQTSLRAAIQQANANPNIDRDNDGVPDPDRIVFRIPGAGPHTIRPLAALPQITDAVVIDGYTQPGAQRNTNAPGQANNAVLQIELSGDLAGNAYVTGETTSTDFPIVSALQTGNGRLVAPA